MTEISFNVYYTIALAVLALMLGDFIKKRIYVLRKFCIPTPPEMIYTFQVQDT